MLSLLNSAQHEKHLYGDEIKIKLTRAFTSIYRPLKLFLSGFLFGSINQDDLCEMIRTLVGLEPTISIFE